MRQTPNEMQITNVIEKERFKYDLNMIYISVFFLFFFSICISHAY